MKQAVGLMLFTAGICLLLPILLVKGTNPLTQQQAQYESPATEPAGATVASAAEGGNDVDSEILLAVKMNDGEVQQMDLCTYLTGVLLGEMPSDFPAEAKKAQAVVSRTYTLRQSQVKKHDDCDICTMSGCCQAWKNPEAFPENAVSDAMAAVQQTDGQVLTYAGKLIDATFFSSSGGRTEAAVAVWGSEIPYLQAVDSPDEDTPYDADRATFPLEEFRQRVLAAAPEADLSGTPDGWLGQMTLTEGGGVETLTIGGVAFSGKSLRTIFGLRSTIFSVDIGTEAVTFSTRGFGHRVGMSQYGAQAMALAGSTYQEILMHYYTDVTLELYPG